MLTAEEQEARALGLVVAFAQTERERENGEQQTIPCSSHLFYERRKAPSSPSQSPPQRPPAAQDAGAGCGQGRARGGSGGGGPGLEVGWREGTDGRTGPPGGQGSRGGSGGFTSPKGSPYSYSTTCVNVWGLGSGGLQKENPQQTQKITTTTLQYILPRLSYSQTDKKGRKTTVVNS